MLSYSSLDNSVYSNRIINLVDLDNYNGRVKLLEPPSKNIRFSMAEQIELKNKPTDYRDALTGTWEHNPIEQLFFSAENMQIIQNAIKSSIYKMSKHKYVLPNQNTTQLKVIMRSTYLQYAEHKTGDITSQIERLNKLVLDYIIPKLFNESVAYEKYCRDQSSLVVPLNLPLAHNRDYKQLELKPWT